MKLLTEPFGHGTGDHISLRCGAPPDSAALIEVLQSFSCYPPAIPKIVACLTISSRYDCVVQPIWFRSQYSRVMGAMAALGVIIVVFELCTQSKVKLQ